MATQMIMGVYRISNTLTDNFYIGSSADVSSRWVQHKASLRRGDHHNFRLQEDWDKWGINAFAHALLEEVESIDDLLDREQYYMDISNPYYNVSRTSTFRSDTKTHGDTTGLRRPHLYRVWQNMKTRCTNPNRATFKYYGGRGITFCKEWQAYEEFKAWSLENGYSPDLHLVRCDNDGGYSPQNCQWMALCEKAKLQKRAMRILAFGETRLLREWSEDARCLTSYSTLHYRIISGWKPELAILTPTRPHKPYKDSGERRGRPLSDTEFGL